MWTQAAVLTIHPDKVLAEIELPELLGTNLALWHEPSDLRNADLLSGLKNWAPGLVRLPGGSWSNEYYWNGNGVRIGEESFNQHAYKDGHWEVDYSAYAPGFRIHGTEQHLSDYHGVIDVKFEHQLAESIGAKQMVTVNVGTGSTEMAVEWLKWTLKEGFDVPYWEIGNELNGQWETGHYLADGSSMTGKIYAQRFLEYVRALKAVDPAIRVGGPASSDLSLAFVEDLIRDAGDEVDFLTFHAYPVGVQRSTVESKFEDIKPLQDALKKIREWKQKYQPHRADQIDVAITEWNMKVNEDRDTADLINGLWSAAWIGTMLEGGVTMANQWDLLTNALEGGHAAFYNKEGKVIPKSHYWAHYLWRFYMGGKSLESKLKGGERLLSFVTQTESAIQVMLINASEAHSESVEINLPDGMDVSDEGRLITFSHREYFWDPHNHRPLWSQPPSVEAIKFGKSIRIEVPAFSIRVVEVPLEGAKATAEITVRGTGKPRLKLIVPKRAPADLPLEVWVVAMEEGNDIPYPGTLDPIKLELHGPVSEKQLQIQLGQSVGRVFLEPDGAGPLRVRALSGGLSAEATVMMEMIESRPEVIWSFDNPREEWGASGTFKLARNPSVKPNDFVAEAIFKGEVPEANADTLMVLEQIPDGFPLERIGGVVGEIRFSPEFATSDPVADVRVILQSEADHWMQIGAFPVEAAKGEWIPFRLEVDDPQRLKAMARLYALRFQMASKKPVTGEIYLDNVGFLLRSN